jgi:6-phosphogluconolactonase
MNQQSEHDKSADTNRNEPEPQTPADIAGVQATAPSSEEEEARWEPSPTQVHRYKNAEALAKAAAKRFLDSAKRAVDKNDRFTVVLAGGSTPRRLYSMLTEPPYRDSVPWKQTFFAFGDERCVPPDDEASNYRMAKECLFDPLEIPDQRVLRDGHTASLFPGTAALEEQVRWVAANHVVKLDAWRLTLTLKALNSARRIIFLATGEEKARVVAEAFGGVEHEPPHPCELVAPFHARREALLDREAASLIPHDADGEEPTKKS